VQVTRALVRGVQVIPGFGWDHCVCVKSRFILYTSRLP
jgi:hypothetical protein